MNDPDHSGLSIFDGSQQFPLMVLKAGALLNNLAEMRDFCAHNDVELAPHCKTHMSPELWRMQHEHGAEIATVATVAQAQAFFEHGIRRILIANEVIDRAALVAIAEMRSIDPEFDVSVLIDSVEGVRLIGAILTEVAGDLPPLPVLVELGARGRRSGSRTLDEVIDVATAASEERSLKLIGVEGYEGVFGAMSGAERDAAIDAFLDSGVLATRALIERQLIEAPAVVTFGGSRFYTAVVERVRRSLSREEATVIIRSGCYLTHDHGSYAESHANVPSSIGKPQLLPAIEVWGVVLSLPEPGLTIVGVGKRDVSYDEGMPIPLRARRNDTVIDVEGMTVSKLNDQHAFVTMSDESSPLRIGDFMAFGISHPCTTFDKWRAAHIVDDDYLVREIAHTLFH